MVAMAVFAMAARPVSGAELVVFETEGCPYCEAWNRDVGTIFHLTREGRILPLRRVEIEDPIPADLLHIKGIEYTPTFVLIDRGREIGRIVGYLGEDFFWGLMGEVMEKLPPPEISDGRNF